MDDLNKKLKEIKIENYIWIIYIGIIILSWYANFLEKKYFLFKDLISKKKYREVMITIFIVLIIIYFYFLKSSYDDLKNLNTDDSEKKELVILSFIGSLFVFFSGLIFLYILYKDENLDVEIAFN